MEPTQFTVCVLLYGDYPGLASRVLGSLIRPAWRGRFQLRVGCNNIQAATQNELKRLIDSSAFPSLRVYEGEPPHHKYPLMRRMFREPELDTPYVMWFDDDSWILDSAPDDWWDVMADTASRADIVGTPYQINLRGNQHIWIQHQPWYADKPAHHGQKVTFMQGGWWIIRTELIHRYDWPPTDISHNGGDVMLGALAHQQELLSVRHVPHLAINADSSGRCSTAGRRGADTPPVGVHYDPAAKPEVEQSQAWLDALANMRR